MKCSECNYYYADWGKGHDYEEGNRPYCHFPSVDSLHSTPWDVAPCEEEEHEEPSDDPEIWEEEESEENEMGWTDRYARDDVENIINNLLYFMMARRYDDYDEGFMEGKEVLEDLKICGFTEEDAITLCKEGGIDVDEEEDEEDEE